jgi:TatD DNase family protein
MEQDIAYQLGDSLYLNITNRCTNACTFCIRYQARCFHGSFRLWLEHEPSVEEILEVIGDPGRFKEIVFCGYGEPLIRLETVKEVASKLKLGIRHSALGIRVDTNGHANLFYQRNILPELKGLVDFMSISLNAESGNVYDSICNSFFGARAFPAVIEFIKEAKKYIPEVEASVVNLPELIDIEKAKKLALDLGVGFRVRSYYEEKYAR